MERFLFEKVILGKLSKSHTPTPKKAPPEKLVKLKSTLHKNREFIAKMERLTTMAASGELYGLAMVLDVGGGEYEYIGDGSFTNNPLLGYAAVMKLAKKFL